MRLITLRYLVVGMVLAVAACANNNPPSSALPPMSFANKPPIMLNVARIEFVSEFAPPSGGPHIELQIPVAPENAIRRWVQDRIQPRGTNGVLRVVIRNASATETTMPRDPNATVFNDQPQTKVDMADDVALQVLDERQFVTAEVTAQASRGETLFTDLKLNERDQILYDMVATLTNALGDQLSARVVTTFHNQILF